MKGEQRSFSLIVKRIDKKRLKLARYRRLSTEDEQKLQKMGTQESGKKE